MLGIRNGFTGLLEDDIRPMDWMSVHGWVDRAGAELGTSESIPEDGNLEKLARCLAEERLDGLLVIGGWSGYSALARLARSRDRYPALAIPMVCVPATCSNNLPGTQVCIGADTALNSIVAALDMLKASAVTARTCFIVEVPGGDCGYQALLSGLAGGAEEVYLPEEGITLEGLRADLEELTQDFANGKRVGLLIRNEHADTLYSTEFLRTLFKKEGRNLFDVRHTVLGDLPLGGRPSPFDRIQAARLTARALEYLVDAARQRTAVAACIGRQAGEVQFTDLTTFADLISADAERPKEQQWLTVRTVAAAMSRPRLGAG
jgi:6-phosphofructokinase 1